MVLDTEVRILQVNRAAASMLGETAQQIVGRLLSDFVDDSEASLRHYVDLCATTEALTPGTLRVRRNGSVSTYRCDSGLVRPAAKGQRASVVMRLTPHSRATQRFKILNERIEELGRQVELRMRVEAVLDGQREVLEQIAHERPLKDVLETLANFIDKQSRAGVRSSILLYDAHENTLRHGAAPRLPTHYCEAIDGIEIGPHVGSCGAAAFLREPVSATDIESDPNWAPYVALAASAGVRACFSMPITGSAEELLGTFALYYDTAREPDGEDRRLLGLLTRTAAIAIERSRVTNQIRALLEREREARSEAEEANRSKDEFLAMVSHELRNPLNAILGWSKVLTMQRVDPETQDKALSAIERNASLQAQLIAEILDYSRITAGKLRLEIEPVDIVQLLHSAVDSARPAAEARQQRLEVDMTGLDSTEIALDAARMQQVINNLLSNALKFTPEHGEIKLSAHTSRKSLHIVVEDNGVGIDPKFLPHVFDRFRQQERTQQSEHEGLGLGLAITKSIVELHHGRIAASSPGRGQGARFEIVMPRRFAWSHERQRRDEASSTDLGGVKLLAVDDAPDTRALLKTLFESVGAEVRVAASGPEALDSIKATAPDILLCDIGMPGMDGYEVVKRMREHEARQAGRHIPAIALTAYARSRDRQRALDAGFDAHMAKPIHPNQLLRVVAEFASAAAAEADIKKPAE